MADGDLDRASEAFLDERASAALLSLSPQYLRKRRADGDGPKHIRFGRAVRYRRSDLLAWAEACEVAE